MKRVSFISFLLVNLFLTSGVLAQVYNRGIGIYPGDPKENFAPTLIEDTKTFRNIALFRPTSQSSSYDYNLTSQLITDGIIDTIPPYCFSFISSYHGVLDFYQRNSITDNDFYSSLSFPINNGWIQVKNNYYPFADGIDSVTYQGYIITGKKKAGEWRIQLHGSNDGINWEQLGIKEGRNKPGSQASEEWRKAVSENLRTFNYIFRLDRKSNIKFFKFSFEDSNTDFWAVAEVSMFRNGSLLQPFGPSFFTSAWKSTGNTNEWITLDLGCNSDIEFINLYWINRPADGQLQISNDQKLWKDIKDLGPSVSRTDRFAFDQPLNGRYIRLKLDQTLSKDGFILSEMEVFGKGGLIAEPGRAPKISSDGTLYLSGGRWRICRESNVSCEGETLSQAGYNDKDWIIATVPGTVLTSYLNAGTIPDPNYSDNQVNISDSYFYSDFWYRTEFETPSGYTGKKVFLNFDGINWKAEVFLNGNRLGLIEGAFTQNSFEISNLLSHGKTNGLAVRIVKNENPGIVKEQSLNTAGSNGGVLGADNPTFHASAGWDWMPTIRGRNTGIWNKVYLKPSGPVTIHHPYVTTKIPLPDTTIADISIETALSNHLNTEISGTLQIKFGDVSLLQDVSLKGNETIRVYFNPDSYHDLHYKNPRFWWPNGYGRQYLYSVEIKFITANQKISDVKTFQTGIREITYSEENETLKIWINGRRFFGRGGNWGFSETNLNYRKREFDAAVRYHKEMNFNIIRNWVGQTGNDEFYEACDKYGIMVWQDFWLANPADGPDPENNEMFISNAENLLFRIRNHPSIVLYCGRNEGYPPEILDGKLRRLIAEIHPDIHYISNSAFDAVSGGGPYRVLPNETYFEYLATKKFHSEIGMPNMVNIESLKLMMPDSLILDQNRVWGIHDFCLESMQACQTFNDRIEKSYGYKFDASKWFVFSQWVNYEGYRAIFEAQSKYRMGALLWMSHPAWPSLVWQTYDYYLEPTAAYFGVKKACEPLHILFNPLNDSIVVVNNNFGNVSGITARIEMIDLYGKTLWKKESIINCPDDSYVGLLKIDRPKINTGVFYLRLVLLQDLNELSNNFYICGSENGNLKAVNSLRNSSLSEKTTVKVEEDNIVLLTTITNISDTPALMVRLKAVGEKSGDRILPVIYSDNYISIMPGESETIRIEVKTSDTRGEKPKIIIEGLNIIPE